MGTWGSYDPTDFRAQNGPKMQFLAQNPFFLQHHSIFLSSSWQDTKKTRFFCWTHCTGGLGAAVRAHFWPENIHFSTLLPYNTHYLGSDGSDPMVLRSLDNFCFPVGGRLAARRAVSGSGQIAYMLNCKINGTVHIFFLKKSYLSLRCPKLPNFFF